MSTMTKVFIVLTAVLCVALSCLFIAAAAQMANWKDLAQTYQELQLSEFTARVNLQAVMEGALARKEDDLKAKTAALDAALKQLQDEVNSHANARNELARARNEAVAAEAGRKKLEEIVGVLTAEYTASQKQNQVLQTEKIDLQQRNARLSSRNLELVTNNMILTDESRNLRERLYACQQQVGAARVTTVAGEVPPGALPVTPAVIGPVRGEITQVDGGYANINIGDTSGVVAGMTFIVHRGATFMAELVIDKVWPKEAGGRLKTVQGQVQPGDVVTYGLEGLGRK